MTGYQTSGGENVENLPETQIATVVFDRSVHEGDVHKIRGPEPLCLFTVEIYPKVLHFGDPLYVRLNYKNSTDTDAYAYAGSAVVSGILECQTFAFHLRAGDVIIPWNIRAGFGAGGWGFHPWQKVKPGEKGPTQYAAFIPPPMDVTGNLFFINADYDALPRWSKEAWDKIRISGASGVQLVIIIENGSATLMMASPLFDIIPRGQEEIQILGLDRDIFNEGKKLLQKQDIEHIIPNAIENCQNV